MKKRFTRFLCLIFIFSLTAVCCFTAGAEAPELTAEAAYVIDIDHDEVIYEKNATERLYPASTTKLMTALLVFEKVTDEAQWSEVISCYTDAVTHSNLSGNGSSAGLLPGEELTLKELLSFLLVQSANDAANVLAQYTAGSVEDFVVMMNKRAAELGMTETHYVNPHGEHDENHYTCARDLSIVMRELVKYDLYIEIATTLQIQKEPTNKYKTTRIFNNTNKLIYPESKVYSPYVICGKTGFTTPAGYCLASYGEHDGMRIVCITMKSAKAEQGGGYHFSDQKKLYKWIFDTLYKKKELLKAGAPVLQLSVRLSEQTDTVTAIASAGVTAMLNSETFDEANIRLVPVGDVEQTALVAPIEQGQKVGTLEVYYGSRLCATVDLEAISSVERSSWLYTIDRVKAFFGLTVVKLCILLAVAVVIFLIVRRELQVRRRERENRLRKYR